MAEHTFHPRNEWHLQPPGIDLIVFGFIFVLISITLPFHDPDFYWHIITGEYIYSTRTLPTVDIFSFTMAGQPWVLHEWLSQLILYWVSSTFGLPGLRVLTGLMFVPAFYLVNRLSYTLNTNLFRTTMLTGVFMILSFPSCSPRPQLFTFLFLAIFVYVLFRMKYLDDRSKLIILPLIMVIWANAHGGYLIGLVLMGIIWATELAQAFFNKSRGEALPGHFKALSITLVVTVLASLLTPYTYELWLYPFQVMGLDAAKVFITEWQSPDFHDLLYQAYLAAIMAYGAVLVYSSRKPDLTEAALSGSFIFLGFLATRNIPLTVLVIVPLFALFARHIAFASSGQHLAPEVSTSINQDSMFFDRSSPSKSDPVKNQSGIAGWVFISLCVIAAILIYRNEEQQDPAEKLNETLPVAAVEFIKENNITGRMFNNYNYGGFLIHEFYPDQKVFIDGRADMYGDELMWEYMNIYNGGENWKELFDKHSIDYALVGKQAPISQLLQLSGEFVSVHEDSGHILLVRKTQKYEQIIEKYAQ